MSQTVNDITNIDDSTVSDFHSISAIEYVGFTSQNMSDFERIITAYTNMPKTQAMVTFYDRLRNHINDARAHNLNIDDISDSLITQLYYIYRSLGFTGTRADMIVAMIKTIEAGTIDQCLAGVNPNKAVTVPGWQAMFNKHESDAKAHASFFDSLLPNDVLNEDPDFYLSSFFGEQNYLIEDDGYTITSWDTNEGTLYLSISYDFREEPLNTTTGKVMSLDFLNFSLDFSIIFNSNDVTNRTLILKLDKNDKATKTSKYIGKLTLAFQDEGYDRILVIYDHGACRLRSMTDTVDLNCDPLDEQFPIALYLNSPLKARSDKTSIVTIKEVAHYPIAASITEQLFFLN